MTDKKENLLETEKTLFEKERWEIVRRRSGLPSCRNLNILLNKINEKVEIIPQLSNHEKKELRKEIIKIETEYRNLSKIIPEYVEQMTEKVNGSESNGLNPIGQLDCIIALLKQLIGHIEQHKQLRYFSSSVAAFEVSKELKIGDICILDALKNFVTDCEKLKNNFHRTVIAPVVGLALSGGGVRSAAFNLGVLQALHDKQILDDVDYLSTVSGGGYIGSALTYLKSKDSNFPFPRSNINPDNNVSWIRRHASYLIPGQGLTMWAFIAALARGILMNLLLILPLLMVFMWLVTLGCTETENQIVCKPVLAETIKNNFWIVTACVIGVLVLTAFRYFKKRNRDTAAMKYCCKIPLAALFWIFVLGVAFLINEKSNILIIVSTLGLCLSTGIAFFLTLDKAFIVKLRDWLKKSRYTIYILESLAWIVSFGLLSVAITEVFGLMQAEQKWILNVYPPVFVLSIAIGLALMAKLVTSNVFYAIFSAGHLRMEFHDQRYFDVQYGDLLRVGTAFIGFGLIPFLYQMISVVPIPSLPSIDTINSVISILGAAMAALGWKLRTPKNELNGFIALLLRGGLVLLVLSGLLWLYHLVLPHHVGVHSELRGFLGVITDTAYPVCWLIIWLLMVAVVDINYVSMHRYYRNRLMEAFFGIPDSKNQYKVADSISDNIDMAVIDVGKNKIPYHIINSTLETVGSKREKYRIRGGDNFIFTPSVIGSKATGWRELPDKGWYKSMSLATAMAISGAAVDPNTGDSRSAPLRVLMALLNVRLGYWAPNPKKEPTWWRNLYQGSWVNLVFQELFAAPNEEANFIRLSDGGHFENLGIYELVRRKCKQIIVSDAGADPDFSFNDLARACERVRVDFDVDIEIDTAPLKPDEQTGYSSSPYVVGRIKYRDSHGVLIYIKTTKFEKLPEDVVGYARSHETFPDESTANQFFTEEQFEAYRELGYQAAMQLPIFSYK